MKFLALMLMLLTPPFGWGLLGFLIYRQRSENTKKADGPHEELAAIHDELALIREQFADIVPRLADPRHTAIPRDTDRSS